MTERHGYGYGDEPGDEPPVSGHGAVTERQTDEQDDEERPAERVVDLTDEGSPDPSSQQAGSTSIFDVDQQPDTPESPGQDAGTGEAADRPGGATALDRIDPPPSGETGTDLADQEAEAAEARPAAEPPPAQPPPAAPAGPGALLAGIDADDVRRRFLDIQAGFVDEPRQAVEEAGRFVEDLVQQVVDALQGQRGRLGAPATGDTEELRQALRGYRQFVDRLLGLAM
jgi:hypothetical protein